MNANYLAAGVTGLGGNLKHTFLTNEVSIYGGMCVYTINTGMQLQKSRLLREITRRGNCEISFVFNKILDLDYYCTMFLSYGGELIVSNILRFFYISIRVKGWVWSNTTFSTCSFYFFGKFLIWKWLKFKFKVVWIERKLCQIMCMIDYLENEP